MKRMLAFEILRVLGVLEVKQQANLEGSKASKILKELFRNRDRRGDALPGIDPVKPAK
jgi:hypothetical protein